MTGNNRNRVLLVSGGSLVGQNIAEVVHRSKAAVELWSTASDLSEPTLQYFTKVLSVPETRQEEETVLEILDANAPHVDAIIPCRDDDVTTVAKLASGSEDLRKKVVAGALHIAAAFVDKMESARLAKTIGIPFAKTSLASDPAETADLVSSAGFPLIAKPRKGFASRGVTIVSDQSQIDVIQQQAGIVLQEYLGKSDEPQLFLRRASETGFPLFYSLEQDKFSIQAVIGTEGQLLGVFSGIHRMERGISATVQPLDDGQGKETAIRWCTAFAKAGWRGPLNIQYQYASNGIPTAFEFNGRFTGATAARTLLGFNEVGMALESFSGIKVPQTNGKFSIAVKRTTTLGIQQPE